MGGPDGDRRRDRKMEQNRDRRDPIREERGRDGTIAPAALGFYRAGES
jgi:hypothetical protein